MKIHWSETILHILCPCPAEDGKPYFDLISQYSQIRSSADRNLKFRPQNTWDVLKSSILSPFQDAPLTGLVLFGLDSAMRDKAFEPPFILETYHPISSIDNVTSVEAAIEQQKFQKYETIEELLSRIYNAAVIVASRINGPYGCRFTVFLSCLVRELRSARASPEYGLNVDCAEKYLQDLPPIVLDNDVFGEKWIPLVSPMAFSDWPQSAIDLLMQASNGECKLGVSRSGHESVDHVVFEMKLAGTELQVEQERKVAKMAKSFSGWEKVPKIREGSLERIALISDCKSYADLSIPRISYIIRSKFENLSECEMIKNLQVPTECDLFILPTLQMEYFDNNSPDTIKLINEINNKNYRLWHLVRDRDLKLVMIPGQSLALDRVIKEVVILPLRVISGYGSGYDLSRLFNRDTDTDEEEYAFDSDSSE